MTTINNMIKKGKVRVNPTNPFEISYDSDLLITKEAYDEYTKNVWETDTNAYKYRKPGEESIKYPNLVKGNWDVSKPLELIVTDMTCIKYRGDLYDTVLYMDAFSIEILAYSYTKKHNSIVPYYEGLNVILDKIKWINYSTTLHSDQGVVYSSQAFTNAHKDYNIVRSMSRAGTPTDNPKMESINGWIKDEIMNDWNIDSYNSFDEFINAYIYYYNNERLACSLDYKTPIQYKAELGF